MAVVAWGGVAGLGWADGLVAAVAVAVGAMQRG